MLMYFFKRDLKSLLQKTEQRHQPQMESNTNYNLFSYVLICSLFIASCFTRIYIPWGQGLTFMYTQDIVIHGCSLGTTWTQWKYPMCAVEGMQVPTTLHAILDMEISNFHLNQS